MQITEIRIRKVASEGKLKAYVTVTFDYHQQSIAGTEVLPCKKRVGEARSDGHKNHPQCNRMGDSSPTESAVHVP